MTGRWVQTALLESMIAMMDFQAARWSIDRQVPGHAFAEERLPAFTGR